MEASPDKVIAGRRNKFCGQLFEQMVEGACQVYQKDQIASIQKTPEPTKFIRSLANGRFIACYEKKAQPDFKGILMDGSCVVFDAKHTDSGQISQSAVSEQQADFMDVYEKMGAHCFVLVSLSFQYFFRVPWSVWKSMKDMFGHKHMTKAELWPYRVPSRMYVAFLEGIELRDDPEEEPAAGQE